MPDDFREFFEERTQWTDTYGSGDHTHPHGTADLSDANDEVPLSRRQLRKSHEKRRNQQIIRIVAIVVVVAMVVGLLVFGYTKLKSWRNARERASQALTADYPGPGTGKVEFTVESGEGPAEIGNNLVKADVVKSQASYTSAVAANNSTLYPGTYELKKHMACADVIAILSDQSKATGFLQVKAGERVSQVIADAAQLSGISADDFNAVINGGGAGILPAEAGGKFEGWFEPGTYNVKNRNSANDIIKEMVDKRVEKLDSLGAPTGADRERMLIIASIAESEVNADEYYGKVVRVILNRQAKNMPLGMDSTVAYGLGTTADKLTDAMLQDASNPYNTRVNTGLPPTPISNPGESAIKAAMNPPEGDWLYFVTVNLTTGETKFATTEDEFWNLRDEYKSSNSNAN